MEGTGGEALARNIKGKELKRKHYVKGGQYTLQKMNKKGIAGTLNLITLVTVFLLISQTSNLIEDKIEDKGFQKVEIEIQEEPKGDCSIYLDKYSAKVGDKVTAIFNDGGYEECRVFLRYQKGSWYDLGIVETDDKGELKMEQELNFPGEYEVTAICDDGACATPFIGLSVEAF